MGLVLFFFLIFQTNPISGSTAFSSNVRFLRSQSNNGAWPSCVYCSSLKTEDMFCKRVCRRSMSISDPPCWELHTSCTYGLMLRFMDGWDPSQYPTSKYTVEPWFTMGSGSLHFLEPPENSGAIVAKEKIGKRFSPPVPTRNCNSLPLKMAQSKSLIYPLKLVIFHQKLPIAIWGCLEHVHLLLSWKASQASAWASWGGHESFFFQRIEEGKWWWTISMCIINVGAKCWSGDRFE